MFRKEEISPASKEKAKFRRSTKWKTFRIKMKNKYKKDFITDKPLLKGFQVHHCDMSLENYKNLKEENFYCLNKSSHEIVHFLFRYKNWRDILKRIRTVLEKMEKLNRDIR